MEALDKNPENVMHKVDLKEAICTDSEDCRTYLDFKGEEVVSQTLQNVQPILRTNTTMRKYDAWSTAGDVKPYARIPIAMWLQWEALGITDDPKALLAAIETMKDKVKVTNRKF